MTDEKLNTSSTSAAYWAKQFCDMKILKQWSLADIDEALMVGWFANYWAAIYDPLTKKIEALEGQVYELEKSEKVKTINDFVYVRRDVIFSILNGIENDNP